jgi:hypothetical protein
MSLRSEEDYTERLVTREAKELTPGEKRKQIQLFLDKLSSSSSAYESAKIASQISEIASAPEPEEQTERRERLSAGVSRTDRPGRTKTYRTAQVVESKSVRRKTSARRSIGSLAIVFSESEEDTKLEVGEVDLTEENLHVSNLGEHLLVYTVKGTNIRNLADLIHPGSTFENTSFEIEDGILFVTIPRAKPFEIEPPSAPIESEKQERSQQND